MTLIYSYNVKQLLLKKLSRLLLFAIGTRDSGYFNRVIITKNKESKCYRITLTPYN